MSSLLEKRLEKYTLKHPQLVLLVNIKSQEQEEQIVIFKGFSSSLTSPTASDPDEPIIPKDAEILSIDKLASPYNPANPQYLQQGIKKETMEQILMDEGL